MFMDSFWKGVSDLGWLMVDTSGVHGFMGPGSLEDTI